jgi:hypothetical protein
LSHENVVHHIFPFHTVAAQVKDMTAKEQMLQMVGVGGSPDSSRLAVHSQFGCGANGGALTAIVTLNGQLVVLDGHVVVASLRDAICASLPPLEAAKDNAKQAASASAFLKQFRRASFVAAAWSDLYCLPSLPPSSLANIGTSAAAGGERVALLLFGAVRSGHVHVWRFEAQRGAPLRLTHDALHQCLELWQTPKKSGSKQRQAPYVTTMFVRSTVVGGSGSNSDTLQSMSLFVGTTDGEVHELSIAKLALSSPKFEIPADIAAGIEFVCWPTIQQQNVGFFFGFWFCFALFVVCLFVCLFFVATSSNAQSSKPTGKNSCLPSNKKIL